MPWFEPDEMGGVLGDVARAIYASAYYTNDTFVGASAIFAFSAVVASRYRLTPATTGLGLNVLIVGSSCSGKTSTLTAADDVASAFGAGKIAHGNFTSALAVAKRGGDDLGMIDEGALYKFFSNAAGEKPMARQVAKQVKDAGLWSMAWSAPLDGELRKIDADIADGLLIFDRKDRIREFDYVDAVDIATAFPAIAEFGKAINQPHWMAIEAIDGSNTSRLAALRAVSRNPASPTITNGDLVWAEAVVADSDEARKRYVKPGPSAEQPAPSRSDEIHRLLDAIMQVEIEVARIKSELLDLAK